MPQESKNEDPQSPLSVGLGLIQEKKYQEAVHLLSQHKDDVWCLHHLGRAQAYDGHLQSALETFQELTTRTWQDMFYENNPHFYIGAILFISGAYEKALASFAKAKESLPLREIANDFRIFRWSGAAHQFNDDILSAVADYSTSIVFQQRQPFPIERPTEALLVEACIRGAPIPIADFEICPFHLDLRSDVFQAALVKDMKGT